MNHQVDIFLSCGCIVFEKIEAVIFLPQPSEIRKCIKHRRDATILKVSQPYWVEDEQKVEDTQPMVPKKNLKK